MENKFENYMKLLTAFFRIGILTFGGGYAMLPMLQREVVEKYQWASEEELLDYYAIGQCTPGVIAVNTATFIGQKQLGVPGGFVATFGLILPSLIIITVIAAVLRNLMEFPVVLHALAGIRVAVVVLVGYSVWKLMKSAVKNSFGWIIFLAAFVLSSLAGLSPVIVVFCSALAGIIAGKIIRGSET